jgi:hypothetical protein
MLRASVLFTVGCCLIACGEKAALPAVPTTACKAGEVRCHGNYAGTCKADAKGWDLTSCGKNSYCEAKSGKCQPIACVKGQIKCSGDKLVECAADGSVENAPAPCPPGQACAGGACVPASCKAGEVRCGAWTAALSCQNGKFVAANCALDEWCDPAQKKCVKQVCAPESQACQSGTTLGVCKLNGSAVVAQACKTGEGCYKSGQGDTCQVQLKDVAPASVDASTGSGDGGQTASDAATGDTGTVNTDAPGFLDLGKKEVVLEQIDVLKATLSKDKVPGPDAVEVKCSIASANYLETGQMLQIQGTVGIEGLEIQIAKIEDFEEGEFFTGGEKGTESLVAYNDGSQPRNVKFGWIAADYMIKLDKFEDKQGRVKGTFSATLVNTSDKTKKKYLTDGVFDIERK